MLFVSCFLLKFLVNCFLSLTTVIPTQGVEILEGLHIKYKGLWGNYRIKSAKKNTNIAFSVPLLFLWITQNKIALPQQCNLIFWLYLLITIDTQ